MVVDIEHKRALKREQMRRYRQRKKALQGTTEPSTVGYYRPTTEATTRPSTSTTKSTTEATTAGYYRPTTKLLQNERESTTVEPYGRSGSTTDGNIKSLTPKPVEPIFKPSKNANVSINLVEKPKKSSIFDFAFGTDNYSNFKKDRLLRKTEKRKNAESILDWVSGLLGIGD